MTVIAHTFKDKFLVQIFPPAQLHFVSNRKCTESGPVILLVQIGSNFFGQDWRDELLV